MKRSFLSNIAYSTALWATGVLLLTVAFLYNHFILNGFHLKGAHDILETLGGYSFLGYSLNDRAVNPFLGHLSQFLFLFATALALQSMSTEFHLIRVRSFFPFFLFTLLAGVLLPGLPLDGTALSGLLLTLSVYRLFRSMEHGLEGRAVFDATVLLAIASLLHSRLLWLLPAVWLVMGVLQILNIKSLMASLLGVLSVFWVIGGISFLQNDYTFLLAFGSNLLEFQLFDLGAISSPMLAFIVFLAILMISAIISFWPKQHLDKLRTRNYLNSVLIVWFVLLVLWFFSGNDISYLLPLLSLSTLVLAHFFSLVDTLFSRIMFIALIGLSLTVYLSF